MVSFAEVIITISLAIVIGVLIYLLVKAKAVDERPLVPDFVGSTPGPMTSTSVTGNSKAGTVSFTSPSGAGLMTMVIAYPSPLTAPPKSILLSDLRGSTSILLYVSDMSGTTNFTIKTASPIIASTAYTFSFAIFY